MRGSSPEDHGLTVVCSIHELPVLIAQERTVLAELTLSVSLR